jgi:Zn-dependent protease with chaperone function
VAVRGDLYKAGCPLLLTLTILVCLLGMGTARAQQVPLDPGIPTKFNLDMKTAALLRVQLLSQSDPVSNRYATARVVFEKLVNATLPPKGMKLAWELRILNEDQYNAYSSPDGTIYVDRGLARLVGGSSGLWAAILSHEIVHVIRRDWARRYLYEKSLQGTGGATLVLGDPGLMSGEWKDSKSASADLALFCRRMELDADLEGLMLMAHAGFHPDFVPALHHLLHAQSDGLSAASVYSMHPCWEERDRALERAYLTASVEFARNWPEWYASPGGNPPVVVFADEPTVRRSGSNEWQIQVPMRCQNLVGTVEVILRLRQSPDNATGTPSSPSGWLTQNAEIRQLTGCTSPKTTITFVLNADSRHNNPELNTDVFVVDGQGAVLSRAEVPKLRR